MRLGHLYYVGGIGIFRLLFTLTCMTALLGVRILTHAVLCLPLICLILVRMSRSCVNLLCVLNRRARNVLNWLVLILYIALLGLLGLLHLVANLGYFVTKHEGAYYSGRCDILNAIDFAI